ncbi:protein FAM117A isoform X3 [Pithys albifrons albifrons]|uniref:protein FAM117A isoform X3 n=1 Tax=Pithys albifrons albifrons TaxID=3385563 RepID=UPI003A5D1E28
MVGVGAALAGPAAPSAPAGLQPLRATVPFQLQQRRGDAARAVSSVPCATTEKLRERRTCSLDTIVGSYLLGQWPRDSDRASPAGTRDKATQTPPWWPEAEVAPGSASAQRRAASWGSADHRREIARLKQQLQRTKLSGRSGKEKEKSCPFPGDHTLLGSLQDSPSAFPCPSPALRLSPCLHRSLEGLNQELEEVFVREQGDEELLRVLDVPDGHRAPAPAQPDSMDASLALEPGSTLWSSLSPSLQSPGRPSEAQPEPREKDRSSPSPVPAFAASPRPNHSFVFKREPPEGCERVRAFEEAPPPIPPEPFQCPDKNKVHFSPSGSAFCPVRLARPLFPAMEFPGVGFLLRSFPAAPGAFLERLPETPARNCEPWKHGQPEESSHAVFQSSLVA